jgi:hypothetical protein
VAQIVETHWWQARAVEQLVEPVRDVRSIREGSALAGEHEVQIDPTIASCKALECLTRSMGAQSADDDRRHDKGSPTPHRFRLDELGALMWDPLRSATHSQDAAFEVEVTPHEAERFALS